MNQSKNVYDTIVIGGGFAGLTCALTLIRRGKRVRLLEKIHMLGGNQTYFKRKGFHFEPNIHSVAEAGEGGLVTQTLASLGMKKPVSFIKLDPGACFIYPYQKIVLPTSLDEFISHPLLQSVIAGFWAWGFPPTEVSGLVYSTLTYSLCGKCNFLPESGIHSLLKLLEEEIKEGGGEISLNSPVDKILIEEGKVYGVKLENGETIEAGAVVSNADANTTLFHMVGEDRLPPG